MTDAQYIDLISTLMVSSMGIMAALGFLAGVKLASLLSY